MKNRPGCQLTAVVSTAGSNYRSCIVFYLLFFLPVVLSAQNAIVGDGFTTGWGTGSCPDLNSTTDFEFFTSHAGSSYGRSETANGTGPRYFRLGIGWDNLESQHTITPGSDVLVTENTEYSLNSNCTMSGAMYVDVSNASDVYYFKTMNAGTSPSFRLIFFKIQGTVRSITSVSHAPSAIYAAQAVTVTANLNGDFASGQSAYLRYTTNNWASSTILEMTGSGTSYQATIPGSANAPGATIQYYCFTSGNALSSNIASDEADWYTINLNNNGGANYSYTINSSYGNTAAGGSCSGFWSDPDCWLNGSVPPAGANVTILENLIMDVEASVGSITINAGKILTSQDVPTRTITVAGNGTFTCNGTFVPNGGTVFFSAGSGNCTVSGAPDFYNVTIDGGGVDFGENSTLYGFLTINVAGFVNSGSPTYAAGSTLAYYTGAYYGRRSEWDMKTPHHVQVSAGTQLDLGANGGVSTARTCNGNLTVDFGSGFYMDYGSNDMTQPLTVHGDVINSGTISLSEASGGDLIVKGDFTQNGTFNCRERAVFFTGTSTQNIYGSQNVLFDYMIMDNTSGLTLHRDVTVDNLLTLSNGVISIGSNDLYIGDGASISVSGPNAAKMVRADGSGMLQKYFSGPGSFDYIIGSAGAYSPVYLAATSLTGTGYIGSNVKTGKHPNNTSPADYLNRYWTVSKDAAITGINYDITCNYLQSDVAGTESSISGGKWDGAWQVLNPVNAAGDFFSAMGLSSLSDFTGINLAPLPVELLDFRAVPAGKDILLTWRTVSEQNNAYFDIQRSADGRNWASIGEVAGRGTTLEPQLYSFTDRQPLTGMNYFRLRQVDFNGAFEYSGIVSVEFKPEQSTVAFYPNPVSGDLFFTLPSGFDEGLIVRICDLNGRLLIQRRLNDNRLNVSELSAGVYFVKLETEERQVLLQERLVKD